MSDSKQAKSEAKQQPIKTIRNGAIAASIWKRQTPTGFEYLDFSLSRSWKLKSGEKEGYSHNFFDSNEDALHEVVSKAAEFIRSQSTTEPSARQAAENNRSAATAGATRSAPRTATDSAIAA